MTTGPHESNDEKAGVGTASDRRRPGRPSSVSAELVPLLRGTIDPLVKAESDLAGQTFGNPDQTRAATGVAVGLGISVALWTGVIAALRHFL